MKNVILNGTVEVTFYQKMKNSCAVLSNILKMSTINVILAIHVVNWFVKHNTLFISISEHL